MEYPEALYNFVMGKHPPGQPISWLRFALFICKEGGRFAEQDFMALPGEDGYSDTVTDEYKERMKKLVELVKKQQAKADNLSMSGIIVSRFRFFKSKAKQLHKAKLSVVDKVY